MLSKNQVLRDCLTCAALAWPKTSFLPDQESCRTQVAILSHDVQRETATQDNIRMLGGFHTLTPNIFSNGFFHTPPKHSRLHSYRLIFITFDKSYNRTKNKQGPWSGATQMSGNEDQWNIWGDPSVEAMNVSSSSRKPHPELVSPNLDTDNQTSELPVRKQQALPWWPMPETQTKVTEEEVGEGGRPPAPGGQERQQPFLRAFQEPGTCQTFPLSSQRSIQ